MNSQHPSFLSDLDAVLSQGCALITHAVRARTAPMHTPVVATSGCDGQPRARVVVLRAFDQQARRLRFHTDSRSDKFKELKADPRIAFLFYDASEKIQMRIEGAAQLHHGDEVADQAWQESQAMSRHCYATMPAPGSAIHQGDAFEVPKGRDLSDDGKPHFVAVVTHFDALEWLWLGSAGHRRARFTWQARDERPHACWLVP